MTTRVVLDTNIFISAFLFGGKPADILQLAEDRSFTLIVSESLITEVEEVLAEKFLRRSSPGRMLSSEPLAIPYGKLPN